MKTCELIIKKLDMQIEHCKDCQDTDGQLKGFIAGLKKAKLIVMDCKVLSDMEKTDVTEVIIKCKEFKANETTLRITKEKEDNGISNN